MLNPFRPLLAATLMLGLMLPASGAFAADTYEIDGSHSTALFRIKHLGVSYAYGRFVDIKGSLLVDEQAPSKGSIKVEIKTASIQTDHEKRDTHLRGPDFFSVKQFPTILFESRSIKKSAGGYDVTGDLTLHGVKRSITTKVEHVGTGKDPWGGTRTGFETTFTIKRSDFGMKFMLGGLSDEVRITFAVEGIRK